MKNWLFLDIDEVVSTFRYAVSIGEIGGMRTSWDPAALNLIENAIQGHDVHLVISSVWRYTIADWDVGYFYKRFRQSGFQELAKAINRTYTMSQATGRYEKHAGRLGLWSTGERLDSRDEEVDNYILKHCSANDTVVVLDDGLLNLKTTTGFIHVTTPYDGLSFMNWVAMTDIFDLGVPNVTLPTSEDSQ